MARLLRIEYPGAWYHVMHRGASHQAIFHTATHFQMFLDLLEEVYEQYKLEVHAYCLMNNHYHLLVHTPYGKLSNAMRHINSIFTQKYNRLHCKDGALFRGRYKAILIEKDSYLLQLSRYIHLNPVSACISRFPENYPWSSYKYFINTAKKPSWFFCKETLKLFGTKNQTENYKKFVLEGINDKSLCLFDKDKNSSDPVLGSENFVALIKKEHILIPTHEEIPGYSKIHKDTAPSIEDVLNAVSAYFNISIDEIIQYDRNKKLGNFPRKVAIYIALQVTMQSQKSIAAAFDGISSKGVAQMNRRMKIELKEDVELLRIINEIKGSILNKQIFEKILDKR